MIDVKANYRAQAKELVGELGAASIHQLPRITKVTVNAGVGKLRDNKEQLAYVEAALAAITGAKPALRRARAAIAGFKLRQGEIVGLVVTLRGRRMDDFLNRLVNITLPRIREFRGINQKSFDKEGNLTLGFRDAQPFAELAGGALDKPFSVGVTVTIVRSDPDKSTKLLSKIGFPVKIS